MKNIDMHPVLTHIQAAVYLTVSFLDWSNQTGRFVDLTSHLKGVSFLLYISVEIPLEEVYVNLDTTEAPPAVLLSVNYHVPRLFC